MLLIILIFIFLLAELKKLYSNGCKYFTYFWNWVDLLLIMGSTSAVLMFFFKQSYTSDFVRKIQANPFETSSTDHVVYWADLEIALIAFAIFIITVKLLSLLRFNRYICQMSGTLKLSVKEMFSFTFVFAVLIMAFTQLGVLVFGNDVQAYSTIYASLRSLLLMLVGGRMYLKDTANVDAVISPIFAFCYMIVMMVVLMNMFCAILCDCHDQVKGLEGEKFADAELGEFMKEYFSNGSKNAWDSLLTFFLERKKKILNANHIVNEESYEDDDEEFEEFGDAEQASMQLLLDGLVSEEYIDDIEDVEGLFSVTRCLSSLTIDIVDEVESEPSRQEERARTIWDRL